MNRLLSFSQLNLDEETEAQRDSHHSKASATLVLKGEREAEREGRRREGEKGGEREGRGEKGGRTERGKNSATGSPDRGILP